MELNTHGYATDQLWPHQEELGRWWRSEETVLSELWYSGFMSRKDWPLKEEMTRHLVRFQQESCLGDPRFLSY